MEKLAQLELHVSHLTALGNVSASEDPPTSVYAAERLLLLLVELAAGINAHVAATLLGRTGTTYAASFRAAADAGLLGPDLAHRLASAAGLRNLLVHRYGEVDADRVAASMPQAAMDFAAYAESVAGWLRQRDADRPDTDDGDSDEHGG